MAISYFEIQLSVKPKAGGEAELFLPKALQSQDYQFVMVREGGQEGVIRLDAPTDVAKKIAKDKKCNKLSQKKMEKVLESYPPPRLKKKFRVKVLDADAEEIAGDDRFELDKKGKPIIDTFQTIRSDFYLIDVPIMAKIKK